MSRKRKSSPGVCDKCGRAVVRATDEKVIEAIERGWDKVTVNGHTYDGGGNLLEVLCFQCEPDVEYWGDGWC